MNDGTLSTTRASPLRHPSAAASSTATATPISPRSLSLRLLATRRATVIADAPMIPGADRSMEPVISTKLMPHVTTARTAAASRTFCTLEIVRKSGLRTAKIPNTTTSAIGGPASRRDTPRRGRGRGAGTTSVSAPAPAPVPFSVGGAMVTRSRPATG
jgi:hypothetical protein